VGGLCAEEGASLDTLVQNLSASAVEVRRDAAYRLNQLGPKAQPALPALIKALDDPDKQVWAQAIGAIAKLGPAAHEAIPVLLGALDTRERRGRRERDRVQTIVRSAYALSRIGPAAIPPLIQALESDDSGVRAGAAKALGGMGPAAKVAIPALRANLGHGDGFVRREVVDALGQIGAAASGSMIEALTWNEPAQRISAALALGQIGREAKGAEPALRSLLVKEGDPLVRAAVLTALPKVSVAPGLTVPLLIGGLRSDQEVTRSAATGALLAIRSPDEATVPALVAMLQDPNPALAERAATVLSRLGSATRPAVPEIVALALKNQPPSQPLRDALIQIGAPAAPLLVAAFGGQNPDVFTKEQWLVQCLKATGVSAVPALTTGLVDAQLAVRFGAVRTLGEIGSTAKPAIPALLLLTADPDPRLRAATLGTLAAVHAEPAILLPKIQAGIGDPVAVVRLVAIQLVPSLGKDSAALDALLQAALQDGEESVRNAAREVIARPSAKP
jgi:HEAT repeat protein